jgi:hypothetical protein
MKTPRYTATQVADALRATRGMVYLSAKRLGCDPNTIMAYCRRYPTVEQAKQEARGELLDAAEVRLWDAVLRGEHWAICFALRTLGKSRGYSEHLNVQLSIEAVASKVADQLGLRAEDVIEEARLLLKEMDYDDLSRPPID